MNEDLFNLLVATKCAKFGVSELVNDMYQHPEDSIIEEIVEESKVIVKVVEGLKCRS